MLNNVMQLCFEKSHVQNLLVLAIMIDVLK
jgi:hypothetical protein